MCRFVKAYSLWPVYPYYWVFLMMFFREIQLTELIIIWVHWRENAYVCDGVLFLYLVGFDEQETSILTIVSQGQG